MPAFNTRGQAKSKVYLHVYDLAPYNDAMLWAGLGVFHSGVEVNGSEWTFGGGDSDGTGVFEHSPKGAGEGNPGCVYRCTIFLGETSLGSTDIRRVLDDLSTEFPAKSYSLVYKNCNSFSDAFSQRLLGAGIPAWVNRLSWMGRICGCCLPEGLGEGPQSTGENAKVFQAFTGSGQTLGGPSNDSSGSASLLSSFASSIAITNRAGSGSTENSPLLDDPEARRAKAAAAALARFGGAKTD